MVTHLARNADAIAHMVRGALDGEARPTHHSPEFRDDAIAAGAGRSAADLLTDLREATAALAELLIQLGERPDCWDLGMSLRNGHELPSRKLGGLRRLEVEVHRVDLLLIGQGLGTWPDDFVTATPRAETTVSPDRRSGCSRWSTLADRTGRSTRAWQDPHTHCSVGRLGGAGAAPWHCRTVPRFRGLARGADSASRHS